MRVRILAIGLVVAGLGMAVACKRDVRGPGTNAPAATRPPRMEGPTAEAIAEENLEEQWKDFYPVPALGMGVFAKGPDGEQWTKYNYGLMVRDLRPSGTQGIVPGDRPPLTGETVTVNYVGMLAETGKEFDRSKPGEPFVFRLGSKSVIRGLSMGLMTLRSGGKRLIYIPAELGYGAEGNEKIPANSALLFEVELLKFAGVRLPVPVEDEIPKAEPLGPPAPKGMETAATAPGTGPATEPAIGG